MENFGNIASLRTALRQMRNRGDTVGVVPTMGALHRAHVKLAETARNETDVVVVTIFVNPAQFGPSEDFDRYPRTLNSDTQLLEESGLVDLVFAPSMDEMYPEGLDGQEVWVDPGPLGERLEGASRAGHFRGVATVVAKLFNIVQPDRAYFGQKDAQQVAVLRAMVKDLALPVDIRAVPTVRESDGLASSSRNAYLSSEERGQAGGLYRAIEWARTQVQAGLRDPRVLELGARHEIERRAPLALVDYVALVDPETFEPIEQTISGAALLALAVRFGDTRLIDNELLVAR